MTGGPLNYAEFIAEVGAMAMGATTYEWVIEHEFSGKDPSEWRGLYGDIPCWVFTHRQLPAVEDARHLRGSGDVGAVHGAMRRRRGRTLAGRRRRPGGPVRDRGLLER